MTSTSKLVFPATTVLVGSGAMGIPENLKKLREAEGLSQTALAKRAGVAQQLISQLERGENLTTKMLPEIARALGQPVHKIDPNFSANVSDPVAEEIVTIYSRLSAHPEWQAYLLDQARSLQHRVLGEAAASKKLAKDRTS